jgi:hypothetical protein
MTVTRGGLHAIPLAPVEKRNFDAPSWIHQHGDFMSPKCCMCGKNQGTRLSLIIIFGVETTILLLSLGIHLASIRVAPLCVCVTSRADDSDSDSAPHCQTLFLLRRSLPYPVSRLPSL